MADCLRALTRRVAERPGPFGTLLSPLLEPSVGLSEPSVLLGELFGHGALLLLDHPSLFFKQPAHRIEHRLRVRRPAIGTLGHFGDLPSSLIDALLGLHPGLVGSTLRLDAGLVSLHLHLRQSTDDLFQLRGPFSELSLHHLAFSSELVGDLGPLPKLGFQLCEAGF